MQLQMRICRIVALTTVYSLYEEVLGNSQAAAEYITIGWKHRVREDMWDVANVYVQLLSK